MTTPGQTVGPFFGYALPYPGDSELVPRGHPRAVRFTGRVLDGAGEPVPDALVEIWQPDEEGAVVARAGSLRRDGWTFTGFGRCATDATGRYTFTTLRPGALSGAAPHVALTVFARGLLDRVQTRAYLPDDDDARASDPLLAALPDDRRRTLLATEVDGGWSFDVRLQGRDETVFLVPR